MRGFPAKSNVHVNFVGHCNLFVGTSPVGAGGLTCGLLDSRNLARILQEECRISGILHRRSKVYIVNPTVDTGSSVERLSFGSVSFVVSSAELPRLWFVPVISVSAH